MNILVSHPTGNSNVRAILTAFFQNEILAEFDTTVSVDPKDRWLHILPNSIRKELLRRSYFLPSQKIWTHPYREFCRMILPKLGFTKAVRHETGWASVDAVYRNFDGAVASRLSDFKNHTDAVYAYEDGSLETFKRAKNLGVLRVYDLPIAYWETLRNLLLAEAERLPQWQHTLGGGLKDSQTKLLRKTQELELADIVVTPSQFVEDSLPTWAKDKKIIQSPFGSPNLSSEKVIDTKQVAPNKPLRILFVGSMGQRKGLGDLFAAMKQLNSRNIELVIMGSLLDTMSFYKHELPTFSYESTRPHNEVLALMRSCDVLCLPSIVEGRALVMQEAMSQGLPLIITANTGGTDLIIEGETGFLVPTSNHEAIAEKIDWFAHNRNAIANMGETARKHAFKYTWENYGNRIVKQIIQFYETIN